MATGHASAPSFFGTVNIHFEKAEVCDDLRGLLDQIKVPNAVSQVGQLKDPVSIMRSRSFAHSSSASLAAGHA